MENIIAYYCAPALAGIKPANLVTCYKNEIVGIHEQIDRLNSELNCKEIFFEIMCECERRVMLMVYRKNVLSKVLTKTDIRNFLCSYGYVENGTVEMDISLLKKRLTEKEFPHEIGAFLGYPLHDIYGFINNNSEDYLLCGEWKVYKNPEEAGKLFRRFASCRKALVNRILQGQTLAQVFCASSSR